VIAVLARRGPEFVAFSRRVEQRTGPTPARRPPSAAAQRRILPPLGRRDDSRRREWRPGDSHRARAGLYPATRDSYTTGLCMDTSGSTGATEGERGGGGGRHQRARAMRGALQLGSEPDARVTNFAWDLWFRPSICRSRAARAWCCRRRTAWRLRAVMRRSSADGSTYEALAAMGAAGEPGARSRGARRRCAGGEDPCGGARARLVPAVASCGISRSGRMHGLVEVCARVRILSGSVGFALPRHRCKSCAHDASSRRSASRARS